MADVVLSETAAWGGQPAVAQGTAYQRTIGMEPDATTLIFLEQQFKKLMTTFDPTRFTKVGGDEGNPLNLTEIIDALRSDLGTKLLGPADEFPYVADLLIAQQRRGETEPRNKITRLMYLGEVSVIDEGTEPAATTVPVGGGATAEVFKPNRLVSVGLVDIRRWWENYGEIARQRINVRLPDGTLAADSRAPGSAQDKPKPWSLRQIFEFLIAHLPGSPQLVDFPAESDITGGKVAERALRLWCARPKPVIVQLLQDYELSFAYNLDGTCSIYAKNDGTIGELRDKATSLGGNNDDEVTFKVAAAGGVSVREVTGPWKDQIKIDGRSIRTAVDRPTEVAVCGGPKVWTVAVDYCVPVLYREKLNAKTNAVELQVIDVTSENLTKLLRGQDPFDPQSQPDPLLLAGDIDRSLFLRLPLDQGLFAKKLAVAETRRRREQSRVGMVDATTLARAQQALAREPDYVSPGAETQDLLSRQIFLAYRLPDKFANFAPLLLRAERFGDGARKSIQVEYFTFQPFTHQFEDEELGVSKLNLDNRKLQILQAELRRVDATIKRLEFSTNDAIAKFLKSIVKTDLVSMSAQARKKNPTRFVNRESMVGRAGPGGVSPQTAAAISEVQSKSLLTAMLQSGLNSVRKIVGLEEITLDKLKENLKTERKRIEGEIVKLQDATDPVRGLQRQIRQKQNELRAAEIRSGGVKNEALRNAIKLLERQLKGQTERATTTAEAKKPNVIRMHVNRGRKAGGFRIVNAERGIFEVTEGLPGWLADPFVSDPTETLFQPMPVRITFGTFNPDPARDPRRTQGSVFRDNEWLRTFADLVATQEALFQTYLADTGHKLPELSERDLRGTLTPGVLRAQTQTRFTFNKTLLRGGGSKGEDPVGRFPWPVLVPDEDFREFVELDGTTNRKDLFRRARDIAAGLILGIKARFQTAERGTQIPEGGQILLDGPHAINVNGRISAVQVAWNEAAGGFETTVSFQSEVEPLPNVEKPSRGQDLKEAFGLDARTYR